MSRARRYAGQAGTLPGMANPQRLDIEFDDRYGDQRPHPWRYCRGGCEAMGVTPVSLGKGYGDGDAYVPAEKGRLLDAALAQHERGEGHEDGRCDGWHFVRCPDCAGTGEIPWQRAVRYLPGMVWRTLRFIHDHGIHQDSRPPHWTRSKQLRVVLWIAVDPIVRSLRRRSARP